MQFGFFVGQCLLIDACFAFQSLGRELRGAGAGGIGHGDDHTRSLSDLRLASGWMG